MRHIDLQSRQYGASRVSFFCIRLYLLLFLQEYLSKHLASIFTKLFLFGKYYSVALLISAVSILMNFFLMISMLGNHMLFQISFVIGSIVTKRTFKGFFASVDSNMFFHMTFHSTNFWAKRTCKFSWTYSYWGVWNTQLKIL